MRRSVPGAVLLLLALPSFGEAAEPLHGNVVLALEGEHPRLIFRKAELPLLKTRAAWPP